jgi:hypothetical protein
MIVWKTNLYHSIDIGMPLFKKISEQFITPIFLAFKYFHGNEDVDKIDASKIKYT